MSTYLVREIESTPNIAVRNCSEVVAGSGDDHLERITVVERGTGTTEEVNAAALFVMIGGEPHTRWLPEQLARDSDGYLFTGRELRDHDMVSWPLERDPFLLETSFPGVFAAGDVRHGSIKRVASAVGDGATVVRLVHDYLRTDERERKVS